ncbi:MAG: PHP domain-containing protein [Bacteroidota bacterium]|nr:PHP domain-containing protein [Bacteroidota bacterium]
MSIKADLHTHTNRSDGIYSPDELIRKAHSKGIVILGITDHDNLGAFPRAIEFGASLGVEVIPGVELSANVAEKEIHILGYFVDFTNGRLLEYLKLLRDERAKRAVRIVEKLNQLNIPLKFESVQRRAGSGAIGRPHIAMVLVDEGFVSDYQTAFNRYIGFGCPAYEKKFNLAPAEACSLIASAGGLSFLAHPGRSVDDKLLKTLIKSGLDGIEVVHPSHNENLVSHYRGIAARNFLLESGGSDFHGGKDNDDDVLGSYYIDISRVDEMKRKRNSHAANF